MTPRRTLWLTLPLLVLGLAVYAFWIEPRRLVITEFSLPVESLTEEVRVVMIAG